MKMRKPLSVKSLEDLGRHRLSESFFMRDFLYSEIAQIERIPNIPDDPELAIFVGEKLCQAVLEPIQAQLGRISIRSAYRSCEVNAKGNEKNYNCANNESNYAAHIWDRRDANKFAGATACIVVNSFIPYYETTAHWQALAWWVHDNISAYANMTFFPKYTAFNISWHENPNKAIYSYAEPKGYLTREDMDNFSGRHDSEYAEFLRYLKQ